MKLEERIQAVESITLTSTDDISTADTGQLLEYKLQYKNAGLTLEQKQATIRELEKQLKSAKQEVSKYKAKMDAAEAAYLASVGNDTLNEATYEYQEATAKLETAQSTYSTVVTQQQKIVGDIANLESGIADLSAQIESANGDEATILALEAQIADLQNQKTQYETALSEIDSAVTDAENELNHAKTAFEDAERAYKNAYTSQNESAANQAALNSDFSEASQLYSAAYNKQASIEQEISNLKIEATLTDDAIQADKDTLEQQFKATKEALLHSLNQELENTNDNGAEEKIIADISGTVIECGVQEGQMISQGTQVAKIKSGEGEYSEIVRCYVPIAEGKKMKAGMTAVVTPATVQESEYGHINGVVEYVGTYTVSVSEMQEALGNDSTVEAFLQQGPCVEVLISLNEDESTVSGYEWSNSKGAQLTLEENTPMILKVRIKEEAPIQKLIPFLKSKLDVESEASKGN